MCSYVEVSQICAMCFALCIEKSRGPGRLPAPGARGPTSTKGFVLFSFLFRWRSHWCPHSRLLRRDPSEVGLIGFFLWRNLAVSVVVVVTLQFHRVVENPWVAWFFRLFFCSFGISILPGTHKKVGFWWPIRKVLLRDRSENLLFNKTRRVQLKWPVYFGRYSLSKSKPLTITELGLRLSCSITLTVVQVGGGKSSMKEEEQM